MAKSGTLATSPGSATQSAQTANAVAKVAPPSPATGTLGSVVKLALSGVTIPALAVVDYSGRQVAIGQHTGPAWSAMKSSCASAMSGSKYSFKPSDSSKSSSPFAIYVYGTSTPVGQTLSGAAPTGLSGEIAKVLGFARPSRSIESLINSLEDACAEADVDGVCLVDQVAEEIHLFTSPDISATTIPDPTANLFASVTTEGSPIAFTVQTDVTAAPGIPNGTYRVDGGSETGTFANIDNGVSDAPLGTDGDGVNLYPQNTSGGSNLKILQVDQTISVSDSSAIGMFQS